MTFGSIETARMLHEHYDHDVWPYPRAPKGFKRIGDGAYRVAILEKSTNLVYKIGDYDCNVMESANARTLSKKSTEGLPIEVRIPRTRTYRMPSKPRKGYRRPECVVVQEFAAAASRTYCRAQFNWTESSSCSCKRRLCYADAQEIIAKWSGLRDIHDANVLVDKAGTFWIIDLAA